LEKDEAEVAQEELKFYDEAGYNKIGLISSLAELLICAVSGTIVVAVSWFIPFSFWLSIPIGLLSGVVFIFLAGYVWGKVRKISHLVKD